jgi:spermidine/putrescine transport system substrate-binding protein
MSRAWIALLLAVAAPGALAQSNELHLFNWNDYIAPETVERFQQSCKCKVVQTFYSDNEELVAKLAAGARGYDVLVPTSNYVAGMAKAGWIQPLDHAKLPNLKNVLPQYRGGAYDPGNKYSAPYAMSITLIGYNEAKIKELGVPVDSWATLFDPKILAKLNKRVTVLDSQAEVFAAALKYLGYSVNELASGNIWLVHGYSNDIFQADKGAQEAKQKFRIRHSLPKEGAVLALDVMVVAKGAPHPELAHQFINFMLDGRNSADLTNMIGSGNPNQAALQYIKPEIKANKAVFADERSVKTLEQLKDLTPKQRQLMNRMWTEIKSR